MKKKSYFKCTYTNGYEKLLVNLPVAKFKNDGYQVIYSSALDVSGYGKTEEEAFDSFKICLEEFLQYTINKKTFETELLKMGWVKA